MLAMVRFSALTGRQLRILAVPLMYEIESITVEFAETILIREYKVAPSMFSTCQWEMSKCDSLPVNTEKSSFICEWSNVKFETVPKLASTLIKAAASIFLIKMAH